MIITFFVLLLLPHNWVLAAEYPRPYDVGVTMSSAPPAGGSGSVDAVTLLLIQLTQDMKVVKQDVSQVKTDQAVLKEDVSSLQQAWAVNQVQMSNLETKFEGK